MKKKIIISIFFIIDTYSSENISKTNFIEYSLNSLLIISSSLTITSFIFFMKAIKENRQLKKNTNQIIDLNSSQSTTDDISSRTELKKQKDDNSFFKSIVENIAYFFKRKK